MPAKAELTEGKPGRPKRDRYSIEASWKAYRHLRDTADAMDTSIRAALQHMCDEYERLKSENKGLKERISDVENRLDCKLEDL